MCIRDSPGSGNGSACSTDILIPGDCEVYCPEPDDVDCVEGSGVELGSCTPNVGSCGSGTQTRTRTGDIPESGNGSACSTNILISGDCEVSCPEPDDVDCQLGSWSNYGSCTPNTGSCGSGIQNQSRNIIIDPIGNGSACGPLGQEISCNVNCPLINDPNTNTNGDGEGDGDPDADPSGSNIGSEISNMMNIITSLQGQGGSVSGNLTYSAALIGSDSVELCFENENLNNACTRLGLGIIHDNH